MNCPRCGSPMAHELDPHERVEYHECWTCGKRVYIAAPEKANAFCCCGRKFVKRGRADRCEACRAAARIKKPLPARTCEACGREYVPLRKRGKYCSKKCQARAAYHRRKPERYCQLCGDPIEGSGHKFCSAACRLDHYRANNAERLRDNARTYYLKNKETYTARARKRYLENRELRRAQSRKWARENRERRREYMRQYYHKNREKLLAQERARNRRSQEAAHGVQ